MTIPAQTTEARPPAERSRPIVALHWIDDRARRALPMLAFALALSGCYQGARFTPEGQDEEIVEGTGGDDPNHGNATDEDLFAVGHLRKLTSWEYTNTIRDLFGPALADDVAGALASLPVSHSHDGYSTMDRSITSAHVDAYYDAALTIARRVGTDVDARTGLDPCLADPDDACIETFAAQFGRRAYRRPLYEDEHARLLDAYRADDALTVEERLENLLLYMLLAPQFLYRPEILGEPVEDGSTVYRLSDYEVASRLSYLLWGSMPDDELLAAAEAAELDGEGLTDQARRMLAHPQARVGVLRFYAEWLGLTSPPGLGFSERFLDGLPTDGLHEDIMAEPVRVIEHLVFEQDASFADLWTTRASFVSSPGLGSIYGVRSDRAEAVSLDDTRRGLLTRAALLLSTGDETSPIERGVFISNRILCNHLTPPDPNAFPPEELEPPPFDPDKSNRERWEEKTSPAACHACHQQINPYGFAAEGYDAIGRTRTHEEIVDLEGQIVNTLPVDTSTTVIVDSQEHPVEDLVHLSEVIATSHAAPRCFAEQWIRYAQGRSASAEDVEPIDALAADVRERSLHELVLQLVATPQFRTVRVKP